MLDEGVDKEEGYCVVAHTLRLPGQNLYLTPLLKAKKFRKFGYKDGALSAFRELQDSDLGRLEEIGAEKGKCSASLILLSLLNFFYISLCTAICVC